MLLAADEIGGGIVRRGGLNFFGRPLKGGDRLTGDEIRTMPRANQVAWMESRALEVWPVAEFAAAQPVPAQRGRPRKLQ